MRFDFGLTMRAITDDAVGLDLVEVTGRNDFLSSVPTLCTEVLLR